MPNRSMQVQGHTFNAYSHAHKGNNVRVSKLFDPEAIIPSTFADSYKMTTEDEIEMLSPNQSCINISVAVF